MSLQLKEYIEEKVDIKGMVVSGTYSPYYFTDILIWVNSVIGTISDDVLCVDT